MRQLKITKSITNRETASVERYLQEISKIDLITAEDEIVLMGKIRKGDLLALEALTKANLRFVVSVAKQYQHQGLTLSDLINEGNLGLIKAAQRFDETKGFKFISYAVWWIRQSIIQAIAEHSRIVRLPLNQISSLNKIHRAFATLSQEYERDPSAAELALLLDIPVEEVEASVRAGSRHASIDAPFATGEDTNSLMDTLQNPNAEEVDHNISYKESLSEEIKRTLKTLPRRDAEVVAMYYGIGMPAPLNLDEISAAFGISNERIRQIKDRALTKLKLSKRSKLLKEYIGI